MPRYIIKLNDGKQDWYLEWSTVVDAPVTYGMSLAEFKAWYIAEYTDKAKKDLEKELEERLARVEERGTSSRIDTNLDSLISLNRAGPKETSLTKEEIIQQYCHERPSQ